MNAKKFIKIYFILTFSLVLFVGAFNYLINPLNTTNIQIFKLKKITQSNRALKVSFAKKITKIDNLILGSSRAQRLDPKIIDKKLGGFTFNFAVGSAKPEDYYGIILYLEKII